jgi:single-stranded DNA-binding protein
MAGIARCTLIGVVGKHGVEVRYATSGMPCASLTVAISEQGQDGRQHDLFVPIEIWGKKAEQAAELEPGRWILFEGKLAWRKKGESWETIVSGFELMALAPPVAASMTDGSL